MLFCDKQHKGFCNLIKSNDYQFLVKLASWTALFFVSLMILAKMWAWLTTGSAAMLGSLTDSILDITATLINFFVLRYALRPADDDHKFGHGKAESLAGLAQAAFIAGSACLLLFHGSERLYNPIPSHLPMLGVYVSVFAIFCTLALVSVQMLVVKKTGSIAIKADSLHYKGDLLLNMSVMIAMLLSSFGWLWADGVFAIAVAVYLLFNAWQIATESADHLMDKELSEDDIRKIEGIAISHPEVLGVHDIRTRQGGQTRFVQLHLELDKTISLLSAHAISDEVAAALRQGMGDNLDVMIHQDPVNKP